MNVLDGVALPQTTRDEVGNGSLKVALSVLLVHDWVWRHATVLCLHLHLMQWLL